ncbi:hypothetical protein F4679DRAFT_596256 [Xylaria curta]|nr:hypothetical protein F4679DRAFT_596256 [Xylaria curta]
MAALLGASALLKAAAHKWSGTLVIVFQPDEEETGGAQAMGDNGLYTKVPIPDIMLGQHIVPSKSGTGHRGSVSGSQPTTMCGPYPRRDEDRLAGVPRNDYVAYADFLLDVKTVEPNIREKVLRVIKHSVKDGCKAANTPQEPIIKFTMRAPLTTNDPSASGAIGRVFKEYFEADAVEVHFTRACEDFSTLGVEHFVPNAYWNFGGSQTTEEPVPTNHSPFFAPAIQPTLQVGTDAMSLVALTFLVT